MPAASAFLALAANPSLAAAASLALAVMLAVIAIIDARTQRIPNALNALLALAGFGVHWFAAADVVTPALGAAAGYSAMFLFGLLYRRIRGHDGIGLGDAKLLGAAGAWLGWAGLPFVVLLGSILGLSFVLIQRARGRTLARTDAIAFGPFLCVAIFAVWLAFVFG